MSVRIGLTIAAFPFSSARAFRRWVELCEEQHIDSIWQTDRLVSSDPFLEPMSVMALLAGATERLKFGMNVAVLGLREPLVLAKQCATIDFMSEGRLLPAFGVGADTAPEWPAVGLPRAGRGARADEALEIMARLWTGESVTFEGKYYHYTDARIAPLPAQHPLPLWIGGNSPAAIRRTAQLGTGWLGGLQTPASIAKVIPAIRQAAIEAGRVIDDDHYGAGFSFRFGNWDEPVVERAAAAFARTNAAVDPHDYIVAGDAPAILERITEYQAAGVSKFVLRPLADGDEDFMQQTRLLAERVLPVVHGER
jgi:probable F420-dependent oxidoreductase